MAERPNASLIKGGYEAFSRGDMATLTELFATDTVWHQPGRSPLSGEHKGRDAVFAFFGKLGTLSGGTHKVELHDLLANDDHVVALSWESASRQGKQLDSLSVQVYHMKQGKITESWSFIRDDRAYDEFWS